MFGLLLRALTDFVTHHYGADQWEAVVAAGAAGKGLDGFEPLMPVDDAVFFRIILDVSRQIEQTPEAVLEALGAWIIEGPHEGKVRGLLRFGGKTFRRFLHSLNELPDRLKLALPFVDAPQIVVEHISDTRFEVRLPGLRRESGWMVAGGLAAMARIYGEEMKLSARDGAEGVGFTLELAAVERAPRSSLKPAVVPRSGRLLTLSELDLSAAVPLYVICDATGTITGASALLERVVGQGRLSGHHYDVFFETGAQFAAEAAGGAEETRAAQAVRLRVRSNGYRLRGMCLPLALGEDRLVMLSFGIDSLRAVDEFNLSEEDFAQTDVAMELQALARASGLIVNGLQQMGARLESAKRSALAQAATDPLTGLKNRRAANLFLERLCARGGAFSLLMLDLDHFKAINDNFGHMAGDAVLRDVAAALTQFTRRKDCVARVGGDEFAVILPDLIQEARLRKLAGDVLEELASPKFGSAPVVPDVGASVGAVAVAQGVVPHPEEVIAACDAALYRAKEAGRGRVEIGAQITEGNAKAAHGQLRSTFGHRG